jgi:hypothetical protein
LDIRAIEDRSSICRETLKKWLKTKKGSGLEKPEPSSSQQVLWAGTVSRGTETVDWDEFFARAP